MELDKWSKQLLEDEEGPAGPARPGLVVLLCCHGDQRALRQKPTHHGHHSSWYKQNPETTTARQHGVDDGSPSRSGRCI